MYDYIRIFNLRLPFVNDAVVGSDSEKNLWLSTGLRLTSIRTLRFFEVFY